MNTTMNRKQQQRITLNYTLKVFPINKVATFYKCTCRYCLHRVYEFQNHRHKLHQLFVVNIIFQKSGQGAY